MTTLTGSCHCGKISVETRFSRGPESYSPRACDCDFCRMHGAAYLSDADGSLLISVMNPLALGKYRQGSGNAEFLFCKECGVLIGVVYQDGESIFGALNARVLETSTRFSESISVSPKTLGPDKKTERWKSVWFPHVKLEIKSKDT